MSTRIEKETRRIWPEIITLLLGLSTSLYTVWAQANPMFYVVPAVLTVIAVVLLFRDTGALSWIRRRVRDLAADRVARRMYPRFVKLVNKAKVHLELTRQLRDAKWVETSMPWFATLSFENWYGDILRSAEQLRVKRSSDVELLGSRFLDFLKRYNDDYLRPFSESFRQGQARYASEQSMKSLREAKAAYDRFLEEYTAFCEDVNEKAHRGMLVPVYNIPPPLDWSAAQRMDASGPRA